MGGVSDGTLLEIGWKSGRGDSSLVPTPREREEEKGPGYHCSRMRLIAVNFHRFRGPRTNVYTPITSKRILNVSWSVNLHTHRCSEI